MKIIVGLDLTPEQQQAFREAAPGCALEFVGMGNITAENAADAEMVIGNPPHAILPQLQKLRVLQLFSAGNEGHTAAIQAVPGARLYNASGAFGLTLAEHMLGALIMLMRKLHIYRDAQPTCSWANHGSVKSVWNSRILVLGLGDVGTMFAERAKAMGAHVIGMKRTPGGRPDCVDELYTIDRLDGILPTVDAVCMSLPHTAATQGILNAARIAAMKPGAYIVNVGRGSAIDQEALVEALNSGHLGGAALDVTVPEPLPTDHPLWTAKNCILTPHVSGGYFLPQTEVYVHDILRENLRAFVTGTPMRNQVDVQIGY